MLLVNKITDITQIGGKAYNLFKLNMKNTPAFWVVPTSFFKNKDREENALKKELNKILKSNKKYAVRSSAIDEDSENSSFAGIHDSFLNVDKKDVYENVIKVYQSAFSARALDYRKVKGLSSKDLKCAVIIQEMVDADFAGVAFTINPATDNPDETVISVTKGLGDKLVSGEVSGTTYVINNGNITLNGEDILTEKQISNLLQIVKNVQNRTTAFQDIEFAIKGNKVYFLQARNITAYLGINPSERDLFIDNANIIESYFGVTSYLTYTFAKDVYRDVYTATLNLGKVRKGIMDALKPSLAEMLYRYEGKIYYNMNSWYHVNSVFPSKNSSSYMENMMGVKSKTQNFKRVKMNFLDLCILLTQFLKKLSNIDELSNKFVENFNRIVGPYYGKEIQGTNEELNKLFKNIEKDIVKEFAIPIVNDCAVMVYFGMLKEKAKKHGITAEELNLYISTNGNVKSVGSATELLKIVDAVNQNEEIKNDFKNLSEEELLTKYKKGSSISKLIENYLLTYGSRVRDELKLETVTMIEDQKMIYSLIKENLDSSLTVKEKPQVEIPKEIEKLANKTKKYIQNRERLRLYRTYVYSVVRNIFLAYARNYLKQGRIEREEDIFYLSKQEVLSGEGDFKEIINDRKAREVDYQSKPIYSRVVFYNGKPMPVRYSAVGNGLVGIPNGNGIVKAPVCLMNSVKDKLKEGNIILTKRTDPGWISLFPKASGLIVEHGSMLSHSFIVAREMNIPAVVGVQNATSLIKDNQTVTLNAIKGEITLED